MTSPLSDHGITVQLPSGWEGRISVRNRPQTPYTAPPPGTPRSPSLRAGGGGWAGEATYPVVHVADFALPADRGDFGSGAVDTMSADNVLVVLFEYGAESVGQPLFASQGLPRSIPASQFRPDMLQRRIPGQVGFQHFFTEAGRAFTLYVVLGSGRRSAALARRAGTILSATKIEPR